MALRRVDLGAYAISVFETVDGSVSVVNDLPGCAAAVGRTRGALDTALELTILLYLDDHPEAPAHFVRNR